MRPCNQCHCPVENNVLICDECVKFNETGSQSESDVDDDLETDEPRSVSLQLDPLVIMFHITCFMMTGLLGVLCFDWIAFIPAGLAGLFASAAVFRLLVT